MALFVIAVPILAGKTDEVRAFTKELMNSRQEDFKNSRKKLGVLERSFLQTTPQGDMIIVTLEGDNPKEAFARFGQGRDTFTDWFVAKVKELHGFDLRNAPDMPLPELLADSGV